MYTIKNNIVIKNNRLTKEAIIQLLPLLLAAISSLIIGILLEVLPAKLPLFYSLPWGENQLATQQQIFLIPAVIVLVALINIMISLQLHQSQSFFKNILTGSSIVSSIILLVTLIKIFMIFL